MAAHDSTLTNLWLFSQGARFERIRESITGSSSSGFANLPDRVRAALDGVARRTQQLPDDTGATSDQTANYQEQIKNALAGNVNPNRMVNYIDGRPVMVCHV